MNVSLMITILHIAILVVVCPRVLLRPYREPAARMAWIVVIVSLPFAGVLAYLLFGEVSVGRKRIARMKEVADDLQRCKHGGGEPDRFVGAGTETYQHLFKVGHSITGLNPVQGNVGSLMTDSNSTIDAMVADIDAATDHVHVMFYLLLPDNHGGKLALALARAVARGVVVRAMADALGSRQLIKSRHWKDMREAGVMLAVALPITNPLLRPFSGRFDLRNHRKILVIDGGITYCGSQNLSLIHI